MLKSIVPVVASAAGAYVAPPRFYASATSTSVHTTPPPARAAGSRYS